MGRHSQQPSDHAEREGENRAERSRENYGWDYASDNIRSGQNRGERSESPRRVAARGDEEPSVAMTHVDTLQAGVRLFEEGHTGVRHVVADQPSQPDQLSQPDRVPRSAQPVHSDKPRSQFDPYGVADVADSIGLPELSDPSVSSSEIANAMADSELGATNIPPSQCCAPEGELPSASGDMHVDAPHRGNPYPCEHNDEIRVGEHEGNAFPGGQDGSLCLEDAGSNTTCMTQPSSDTASSSDTAECSDELCDDERYPDGMFPMSAQRFEELVGEALDELPEAFAQQLDNLVFLIEDNPLPEHTPRAAGEELLGLYDGRALTDGDFFGYAEPNRIWIFREPTLRMCRSEEEVAEQVRITVFHEVAHHFGIDDEMLHETGWA
ncbi:metallopeptidase family protein [Trueperella sp. LYQ143]|uniref:metallopeptidase family protein n=1 Tax=Trueperella sp. LYQ143 TaxID=3391059 RepID=UPI0039830F89